MIWGSITALTAMVSLLFRAGSGTREPPTADLQSALAAAHFTLQGEAKDLNEYHYLLLARRD